jgi:hypothetical protein
MLQAQGALQDRRLNPAGDLNGCLGNTDGSRDAGLAVNDGGFRVEH